MKYLKNITEFRSGEVRNRILEAVDQALFENSPDLKVKEFLEKHGTKEVKGRVVVIGFGKAGKKMYEGAKEYLGASISRASIIVPKQEDELLSNPFLPGNHPLPSAESIESSKRLVASLENLKVEDLVIVLISGGGSSLFEILKEGVKLDDYNLTVKCLMQNGATIGEINSIRYLFSETKGGGLLKITYPARVLGLILSDVPGDDPSTVASGPTSSPPKSSAIHEATEKFGRLCNIPSGREGPVGKYSTVENTIILKNVDFVNSIKRRLESEGFDVLSLGSGIEGDTESVAARIMVSMRQRFAKNNSGFFLVGGGETSTRRVSSGIGGRNLELCLRILLKMQEKEIFTFGSFGTDGIDGSSNAMGAIVDNYTLKSLGRKSIEYALSRSESLAPLKSTKDVIFTGLTGTNAADIFVGYYGR